MSFLSKIKDLFTKKDNDIEEKVDNSSPPIVINNEPTPINDNKICQLCDKEIFETSKTVKIGCYRVHTPCARKLRKEAKKDSII